MQRLHIKVDLSRVFAKADSLSDEEIANFKVRVSPKVVGLTDTQSTY